jgi:hypothetical protein
MSKHVFYRMTDYTVAENNFRNRSYIITIKLKIIVNLIL